MARFTDSQKRQWVMAPTIGDIKRIRDLAGVDMFKIAEGNPPKIADLIDDPMAFVDVLFALVKPQADEQGVSDEQFAAGLDGDAMYHATQAFWEGMADFFRNLHRQDMAAMIDQTMKVIDRAVEINLKAVNQASTTGDSSTNSLRLPEASTRAG